MLFLNVLSIFSARGIERPSTFLIKAGFSAHSAHYILHGKTRSIRLDHIESLCKLLICEPSDLFTWKPDQNENLPASQPITKLRKHETQQSIQNLITDMPFKQIKEIAAVIKEKKEEAITLKTKNEA